MFTLSIRRNKCSHILHDFSVPVIQLGDIVVLECSHCGAHYNYHSSHGGFITGDTELADELKRWKGTLNNEQAEGN